MMDNKKYLIRLDKEYMELHDLLKSKSIFYKDALLFFAKNNNLCHFYFKDEIKVSNILKKYGRINAQDDNILEHYDEKKAENVESTKKITTKITVGGKSCANLD